MRKGFFPHLFNTLENQHYEGPMPKARFYDPDDIFAKKKTEFERWYAEQVRDDVTVHLQRDMASYCESDVKLLKAGCQNFQEEFEDKAEFNSFVKCVTIAAACNRFLRKNSYPSTPSRPSLVEAGRELSEISSPKHCNGWRGKSIVFALTRLPRRPTLQRTASDTCTT